MRPTAFGVFVAILVVLDVTLHTGLGLGGVFTPDLIAVAVLMTARRPTLLRAVVLGLGLGLLDDAMGIGNLGSRSLALGVAAIAGSWTLQLIEGENPVLVLLYLFVGAWLIEAVGAIIVPGGAPESAMVDLIGRAPAAAAVTAVAGTLALAIFRLTAGRDA